MTTLPTTPTREEGNRVSKYDSQPEQIRQLFVVDDGIDKYVEEYELRGDDIDHIPTEFEALLIQDAMSGYVGELHERVLDALPAIQADIHSSLTTENARLAERVRVLEGELKKIRSVIPMNFLIAHDTPGATGPTDALDLVGAIRSMVHNARKWEDRARSALTHKDGE